MQHANADGLGNRLRMALIDVSGQTYTMCWSPETVQWTQQELRRRGVPSDQPTLCGVAILFAGSLRRCHPEIDADTVCTLMNLRNFYTITSNLIALTGVRLPTHRDPLILPDEQPKFVN